MSTATDKRAASNTLVTLRNCPSGASAKTRFSEADRNWVVEVSLPARAGKPV